MVQRHITAHRTVNAVGRPLAVLCCGLLCALWSAAALGQPHPAPTSAHCQNEAAGEGEQPPPAPAPSDAAVPEEAQDEGEEDGVIIIDDSDDLPLPEDSGPQDPEEALRVAKEAYIESDYDRVVALLMPLTDAQTLGAYDTDFQKDVYRLLGLAHLLKTPSDRDGALTWFEALLELDNDFAFIEGLAPQEAIDALEEARKRSGIEPDNPGGNQGFTTIYIQREVEQRYLALAFMPFGIGQFQNGDSIRGGIYATVQGLALGTNIASFGFIEIFLRGEGGLFTPKAAADARITQRIQFISLGIFAVAYIASVTDALVFYESESVNIRRLTEPPPELTFGDPTGEPPSAIDRAASGDDTTGPPGLDAPPAMMLFEWGGNF